MNGPSIVSIVEGHGEIEALPRLVHRIFSTFSPQIVPRLNAPIRVKAGSFLQDADYFRKQISLAAAKAAQAQGRVLILLDCEDACPAQLGPALLSRAIAIRADVPYFVVLAHREFETWFIAGIESLRGRAGLPADVVAPNHPESTRGAKEWLSDRMNVQYDPIQHQLDFATHVDLHKARSVPSFERLVRKLIA